MTRIACIAAFKLCHPEQELVVLCLQFECVLDYLSGEVWCSSVVQFSLPERLMRMGTEADGLLASIELGRPALRRHG
mgnify:CR=1 FL=1